MAKVLLILSPDNDDEGDLGFKTAFTIPYRSCGGPFPPLGLLSLANAIKSSIPRNEISFLDGQLLSKKEIIDKLNYLSPDIVGISPMMKSYGNALEIAHVAKSLGSRVIFGGFYASGLAKEISSNRGPDSDDYCVDAVVQGDGEEAICNLIKGINLRKINNLTWQEKTGRIIENKTKNLDINKFSFMSRDGVDVEKYFKKQKESGINKFNRGLTMISRKGCAWRAESGGCIFCSRIYKEVGNIKRPELFWKEVIYLSHRYNIDFLWDGRDDFLDNEKWLKDLVSIRPSQEKLGKNLYLQLYARIDNINNRTVKLLKNLDLPMSLVIGFENSSDKMLNIMNKGSSFEDAMKGVELLKKYGIRFTACFVLGCPKENQTTLSDTVDYARKLKQAGAAVSAQILKLYPGSRAFELVVNKNKSKYANRDLIDFRELIKDWVADFCDVSLGEILKAFHKIEKS